MEKERDYLNSLQVLRALAFLGVFTTHTGIRCFHGAGAWGVSVFFILSGFIMIYSYYGKNRIESTSFIKNLIFAWNKIKGLYLLHVVTTLAMAVFMFIGDNVEPIAEIISKLILNLVLMQQWIPAEGFSINNVSWYLCVTLFLYILFPWILKYMEKGYSVNKAKKMIVILFFIQIMTGLIGLFMSTSHYLGENWINRDITYWFVYQFPPTRALDFVIGCNVGYLFLVRNPAQSKEEKYTIYELLTFVLIIVANICYIMLCPKNVTKGPHPERWWTYSTVFTISSCMIVYLFAENKGHITKFLSNRIMLLYLGNISQYTFLIHYVVFTYLGKLCHRLTSENFVLLYEGYIKLFVGFILTLVATQIWMKFLRKYN